MDVPDFATHYYLADKKPFLNLSELSESERGPVLADLERRRTRSDFKRVSGRRYMDLRRLTEARLLDLFRRAGGRPERTTPHYLILGPSEWYRGLAPDTREVVVALADLPLDVTSFTYPDSFTAMGFLPRFGLPYLQRPYHDRIYRMQQLREVVRRYGMPPDDAQDGYDGYHLHPFEKYIEIQVWSDAPVRDLHKTPRQDPPPWCPA
jgi:hypothetical protein